MRAPSRFRGFYTVALLALSAQDAGAGCPDPDHEQAVQLEICSTWLACRPVSSMVYGCAATSKRIKAFLAWINSSKNPADFEMPPLEAGEVAMPAPSLTATSPVRDSRTPAERERDEANAQRAAAELKALMNYAARGQACREAPAGASCGEEIKAYQDLQTRISAYNENPDFERFRRSQPRATHPQGRLRAISNDAIDYAIGTRAYLHTMSLRREAESSVPLETVVAANHTYDAFVAASPERAAAAKAAAERQKLVDAEKARQAAIENARFQAELERRDQESRQGMREAVQALADAVDAYAESKSSSGATDCEAIKAQGREATLDAGCDWGGTVR